MTKQQATVPYKYHSLETKLEGSNSNHKRKIIFRKYMNVYVTRNLKSMHEIIMFVMEYLFGMLFLSIRK